MDVRTWKIIGIVTVAVAAIGGLLSIFWDDAVGLVHKIKR